MNIVEYEPTQIIKIQVGDLTLPVDTGVELSKLAVVEKTILVELLKEAEKHEESGRLLLHPDTLPWAKELRLLLKDIHEMTKGVQEKAMLKQMDVVGDIYKQALKNMDNKELVTLIRKLEKNGDPVYTAK